MVWIDMAQRRIPTNLQFVNAASVKHDKVRRARVPLSQELVASGST